MILRYVSEAREKSSKFESLAKAELGKKLKELGELKVRAV
jgi:hypothetical protein